MHSLKYLRDYFPKERETCQTTSVSFIKQSLLSALTTSLHALPVMPLPGIQGQTILAPPKLLKVFVYCLFLI